MAEMDRKPHMHTHRHSFIWCDCADRQSLLRSPWRERCEGGYRRSEPQQIKPFGEKSCSLNTFFLWAAHWAASKEGGERVGEWRERDYSGEKNWWRKRAGMKGRKRETSEEGWIKDGLRRKKWRRGLIGKGEEEGGFMMGGCGKKRVWERTGEWQMCGGKGDEEV